MGKLIRFWQKDLTNKLIVLVVLVILLAVGIQVYLVVGTPGGKTFIANLFPTPTPSVDEIFRIGDETITAQAAETRAAIIPTITTMPFTPMVQASTPTLTPSEMTPARAATATPALSSPLRTQTLAPSITPTRRPTALNGKCLPGQDAQVGKVVDIVDGATVRVLIGDLVYVVHYIGVILPPDPNYAQLSTSINGQLVFAKEVKLYTDGAEKDDNNRLLRYLVVGDSTLVNQDLIRKGLATADTTTYACAAEFSSAEQDAKADRVGIGNKPMSDKIRLFGTSRGSVYRLGKKR